MRIPATSLLLCVAVPLLMTACGGGTIPRNKDLPTTPDAVTVDPGATDLAVDSVEPRDLPVSPDEGQPEVVADVTSEAIEEVAADVPAEAEVEVETVEDVPLPPPCEEGKLCDDQDPCTYADRCTAAKCAGTKYTCGDGKECTHDLCDGAGGCRYPVREDRCLVDGGCYKDGDTQPENPCMSCVPTVTSDAWTASDGVACDDLDFCTIGDSCVEGKCIGLLPNACDDSNWCTDDACDPSKGCSHVPNARPCSDGDACTVGDFCDKSKCWAGPTQVTCDDHNPCTDDACDKDIGCVHTPNANLCDDGDGCTLNYADCPAGTTCPKPTLDHCEAGVCVGGIARNCADMDPCTEDSCYKGNCLHTPADNTPCDDGNVCTDGDACSYGKCMGFGQINCNDDNPCTEDSCDPGKGGCQHLPAAAACDDGDPCTVGDFCENGACRKGGISIDCDDDNPCTADACGSTGSCDHVPVSLDCNDGNPCTVGDACVEGFCTPGVQPRVCNDDNVCTDDACDPATGCIFLPNTNVCSDGNACTVGDHCANSICVPGSAGAVCNDDNPCTLDVCGPAEGCVSTPANGVACNDGSACTFDDTCQDGMCVGSQSPCDDGNICTDDICLPGGGCENPLKDTAECRPEILVTYPPRGAMLKGPPDAITVTGSVTSKGGAITSFTINGVPVTLNAAGAFSHPFAVESGTNILRFQATNAAGGLGEGVRAFQFSHKYYPSDIGAIDKAAIPDGVEVFLGPTVWDDNDPSKPDDFASIILLLLKNMNIAGLIPDPLAKQGVLYCNYTVRAKNLKYTGPDIDLIPVNGALRARVRITNLSLDIEARAPEFACVDVSGDVKASAITVEVDLAINVVKPGDVKVTLVNRKATISGLDISLDGFLGFLLNWLIDLFSNVITGAIEDQVIAALESFIPTLEQSLESLAIEQDLPIPPLLGSGKTVTVKLKTMLSRADFQLVGGVLGLSGAAASKKGVTYKPLGSIARSDCLQSGVLPFQFAMVNEMEAGIFDDFLNQILYAVWYGGALEFTLTEANLPPGGPDLGQFGVSDLVVKVSFMLPPMLTDCTPDAHLAVQVGDVWVHASMVMVGQPLELDAYASASARAAIDVVNTATGPQLSLGVGAIDVVDIEIESVSGGMASAKGALTALIKDQLLPMVFDALGSGAIASFPIPDIDLGGMGVGLPAGTKLTLNPKKMYRQKGYTVLSGEVK